MRVNKIKLGSVIDKMLKLIETDV
ncbi:hypothetical protein TSAR_007784 [Trichomalopsis sarcophagae]|uniref:Uncharacterized protein n=1 Tax=Trichomalopsis sarcophagae TaxID=543379 RepID=A0A232FL22_9HYME|nr:hypothetical protein TSAR_007784 [Trichomalopsis sarcophagae]